MLIELDHCNTYIQQGICLYMIQIIQVRKKMPMIQLTTEQII